jgi:hypothetical protein
MDLLNWTPWGEMPARAVIAPVSAVYPLDCGCNSHVLRAMAGGCVCHAEEREPKENDDDL